MKNLWQNEGNLVGFWGSGQKRQWKETLNGRDRDDAMRDMLVLLTSILEGGGKNDN